MHLLITYVPASHLDAVKQALFAAGAGRIGNYEHCCWQVQGQGQFRPLAGSTPFLGETDTLHYESEYRLEISCDDNCMDAAITALLSAHPYEEPAWAAWPVRSALD